jgi:hypothetical protein
MVKGQVISQGFRIDAPVMESPSILSKKDTLLSNASRVSPVVFKPMKGLTALQGHPEIELRAFDRSLFMVDPFTPAHRAK